MDGHGARGAGRSRRRVRLRQLGHGHAAVERAARRASVPQRPHAATSHWCNDRWVGCWSRCGPWARTSTDAPAARLRRSSSAAADSPATEHRLSVASAQVKTALVLAGLQAVGHHRDHRTRREPRSHRAHARRPWCTDRAPSTTASMRVTAGAPQPFELEVPGDPSSAAFWVVAAAITPGSELTIDGVALNPSRIAFVDVLCRMGADIEITVTGGPARRAGRFAARHRGPAARHDRRRRGDPLGHRRGARRSRWPLPSPKVRPRSAMRPSCG